MSSFVKWGVEMKNTGSGVPGAMSPRHGWGLRPPLHSGSRGSYPRGCLRLPGACPVPSVEAMSSKEEGREGQRAHWPRGSPCPGSSQICLGEGGGSPGALPWKVFTEKQLREHSDTVRQVVVVVGRWYLCCHHSCEGGGPWAGGPCRPLGPRPASSL